MTDNPRFGATQEDAEYRVRFSGGFFPGMVFPTSESVPSADTAATREELFRSLVDLSRTLPQMGPFDPAGAVERSRRPAKTDTPTPASVTEATQPKRGIIQKILRR